MSGGGRGRERERVVVSSDGMARAVCREARAPWDQAGTKAGTNRKSVYVCQKYYWFDKTPQILLMHNLKLSAAVKIPLSRFGFWEEDEERLWDGNNQDIGEWEGSARFISCILTQPQMCSSVSPRRPQCWAGQVTQWG